MGTNRVRHGPVKHGVDAAEGIGGELMPMLRVLL